MSRVIRSLILGAVQILLLGAVYGRFAYDRATLPRSWVAVRIDDPESLAWGQSVPRGRYLLLETVDTSPVLRFEFYIPEHTRVPHLAPGEELWAEITRTRTAPRAIQLAIRSQGQMRPFAPE